MSVTSRWTGSVGRRVWALVLGGLSLLAPELALATGLVPPAELGPGDHEDGEDTPELEGPGESADGEVPSEVGGSGPETAAGRAVRTGGEPSSGEGGPGEGSSSEVISGRGLESEDGSEASSGAAVTGAALGAVVDVDPANYRMVLAGDVVVGLGGVGFVTMAAGLALRADASRRESALAAAQPPDRAAIDEQSRRSSLGTNLALVGGVSAVVLIGAGVTMIALGRARERARRRSLGSARRAGLWVPTVGRGQLGLSYTLRF